MTPEELCHANPGLFLLTTDGRAALDRYLCDRGVLETDEQVVGVEPAGDGNMNLTVRVVTSERSLIVKQSRPWVERYPTIAAPWDRVLSEAQFYSLTKACEPLAARMPHLIAVDSASRVIVLEDLGRASDYSGLYAGEALDPRTATALSEWLSELHALTFDDSTRQSLTNREMRRLNHEHLFRFPLDPNNGLDLDAITPGLGRVARSLADEVDYVERITALGEVYLSDGAVLLHGDFFPGSWLNGPDGPAVIDPEFAFFGPAEFDVGVFLGHLCLASQDEAVGAAVRDGYRSPAGFDWQLAEAFAGVEIMRRLIGVAQLPLSLDLEAKRALLECSRRLVLGESSGVMSCRSVASVKN